MKFLDPNLELEWVDGRLWKVTAAFSYAVGAPDGNTVIRIEPNEVTDFASVPKFLWPWLPPTGWYGKAALLHDHLYRLGRIGTMIITRKYADDVLAEAMRVIEADRLLTFGAKRTELKDWLDRAFIYYGVRLGGFVAWNRYRKAEAA